jgi:hypothetical protein
MSLELRKKSSLSRQRPSIKTLRKAPLKANVPLRPDTDLIRPGTNLKRIMQRDIRRAAARQASQRTHAARLHPAVRPLKPPLKVMPKTAAPKPNELKKARKIVPPRSPGLSKSLTGGNAAFGLVALNTSSVNEQIAPQVSALESSLAELQTNSQFPGIRQEISDLDSLLDRVGNLLESARSKDYLYQGDLEEATYKAISHWQTVRPQVERELSRQADSIQNRLRQLNPRIQRLNAALPDASAAKLLQQTQSHINGLLQDISRIESALDDKYEDIQEQAWSINSRLSDIHWALAQLDESKFNLGTGEDLVMAVPARWDKQGKDDPEGVLFLTNQRLLFERKEKVATKKVLFITTASELVQEPLVDQQLNSIQNVKAENKGLFGHQDFIEVTFSEHQPPAINLHLDGQDSAQWATLIQRSQLGQIEEERTRGSGRVSIDDLSRPLNKADIVVMQNEVSDLQDEAMLKDVRSELANLENRVHALDRKLSKARARGYVVEKALEADIKVLATQWDRVKSNAEKTLVLQSRLLSEQMNAIQHKMAQLTGMSDDPEQARPIFMQLKSSLVSMEAQADAAEMTVLAQYDQYADEIESLDAHLDWVYWMLEALSTASFRLLSTESGVAATEAFYQNSAGEIERGILFLTDQRLLWEDRGDDYELKVEVPINKVEEVQKESPSSLQEELAEDLNLRFGPGESLPSARFGLGLPLADLWIKMIARARDGDYSRDRAVEIPPEELERIRNAPQQCNNCGAAVTTPILRGQTEILCEYCGSVTRF